MDDRNYCKTCNAPIAFVAMASGLSMPVNYQPVVIVQGEGKGAYVTKDGHVIRGRPRREGEGLSGLRRVYISHFSDCPDAAKHRKARMRINKKKRG